MQVNVGSDKEDATIGGDGEALHLSTCESHSHNSSSANEDSSAEDNHQDAPSDGVQTSDFTGIGGSPVNEAIVHPSASSGLELELGTQILQNKFVKKHFRSAPRPGDWNFWQHVS
ncbi:MAG: hypothetical protein Q9207_004978 [Kuettlingeria erythrocarpa]